MKEDKSCYQGFETGPIRPPSEAGSLMLRITRNCSWNRCTFCGLYKGTTFSKRPVEHIKKDIDRIKDYIDRISSTGSGDNDQTMISLSGDREDPAAFHSALNWYRGGMESVFLQDANTLIVKPDDLVAILAYLKAVFPRIQRITSYARSHTIARISDADMDRFAAAGLNRIHVGMESASDDVLAFVKKGVDRQTHIIAGKKVKRAGIELSEYFMPGLGGAEHSKSNALDTADALNQINPEFIRIRTLAVTDNSGLAEDVNAGRFSPLNDVDTAKELLMFLDHLHGITSAVKSDHILNLFQEVDGVLPRDKEAITQSIRTFLAMDPEQQTTYRVGRRTGIFSQLADLNTPNLLAQAEKTRKQYKITPDNVDAFTETVIKRFI